MSFANFHYKHCTFFLLSVSFFLQQYWLVIFRHCPSKIKSSHISRSLLSILDNLDALVSVVSILSLISISPSLFSMHLWTVPSTPIAIDITVTNSYFSFISPLWSTGTAISSRQGSFFLLDNTSSCLPAEVRLSACTSKYQRILSVLFSSIDPGLCIQPFGFLFV